MNTMYIDQNIANITSAEQMLGTAAADRDTVNNVIPMSSRRRYSERGPGTGYGNSSGYALDRRYTSDWGQLRFRCG